MPEYVFFYHAAGQSASPTAAADQMAKWNAWVAGLGNAMVNPGTPVGKSQTVSSGGISGNTGPDALTGFSIVKAENMDAALRIAKGCPFLEMGTIEVAEVMKM